MAGIPRIDPIPGPAPVVPLPPKPPADFGLRGGLPTLSAGHALHDSIHLRRPRMPMPTPGPIGPAAQGGVVRGGVVRRTKRGRAY